MRILAGDIGGTNTRLIFVEINIDGRHILAEQSYLSAEFTGLVKLIETFFFENDISAAVDAACFAVAGPVKFGVASVTNLPWVIGESELSEFLNTPQVTLINDFVSVSYGISELEDSDMLLLQQGLSNDDEPFNPDAVVIGAGTGLGASHLVWQNDHYQPHASEAGHAGFAPENELQCALLTWLQKTQSHVSLEMLLSGRGLATIYKFLYEVMGLSESLAVNKAMKKSDSAQVITEYALSGSDKLCQQTVDCFIDIYGAAAGNVALHYYPIGEVFIAGGIAPKIKNKMLDQRFTHAFANKGAMSSNMKKITIKLVCQDKVGLYGALSHAQTLYS